MDDETREALAALLRMLEDEPTIRLYSQERARIARLRTWLTAQDAPAQVWTPVGQVHESDYGPQPGLLYDGEDNRITLYVGDEALDFVLPDNLRLCARTPAREE
jgi:hypothetical protein